MTKINSYSFKEQGEEIKTTMENFIMKKKTRSNKLQTMCVRLLKEI